MYSSEPHHKAEQELTYLQQLCTDTGCSLEDLPVALDDRDEWRDRVREFRARDMPWLHVYIYIY